jgi:TolB-like protein
MPQTADVFISYSREDKDRVIELAQKLREAGVSLWIDQGGIDGAAMWSEEIVNALENSKVLMLMVSEKAVNSHNVVKEVTIASERKGHILPIHLEPTRIPQGLKYPLAGIQHIEYFQGEPKENLKSILRALERLGVQFSEPPKSVQPGSGGPPIPTMTAAHSMHSSQPVELDRAIAVLPFHNISPDKETDYFSDGLTEELITSLSRLKDIRVVPGTTTMPYKGTQKPVRMIGEELHSRFVITGSVRKHMDNLRVAAQLIDAQTDAQLWAETYKGKLEDVFEIQENVARQIVDALSLKLTMAQEIALTIRTTDKAEALDYYLRGRDYLDKSSRRNTAFAIQLFERAIEMDTRYAGAYAGLSEGYSKLFEWFDSDPDNLTKAMEAALKATLYDPNSAEGYAALALAYLHKRQLDEAVAACAKSIELNPELYLGYRSLGRVYHLMDRDEEAITMFEHSAMLKPSDYGGIGILGSLLRGVGRGEEYREHTRKLLEFFPRHLLQYPDDVHARTFYAVTLVDAGLASDARREADGVLHTDSGDPLALYNIGCCFSKLGDTERAIQSLQRAIAAGFVNYEWIKRDSDFDPIRTHPGYIDLMKDK